MGASEETTVTVNPQAHDEATARLYGELDAAERKLASRIEQAHRVVGDVKLHRWTRQERWALSTADTYAKLAAKAGTYPADEAIWGGDHPVSVQHAWDTATAKVAELHEAIELMDAIYNEQPWQRFFPCNNSNGHIHASLHCHTLNRGRYATDMGWYPSLSGKTVADAVAELGTWLCSHCFPDAPAEHCQTRSEATRAQRDADKAAKEEARYVKQLRKEEEFKGYDGAWVRTVAGAKQALRDEVEFRDYYGRGEHPYHEASVESASLATSVLLLRGVTQEDLDKIVNTAVKKNRKEGARI